MKVYGNRHRTDTEENGLILIAAKNIEDAQLICREQAQHKYDDRNWFDARHLHTGSNTAAIISEDE